MRILIFTQTFPLSPEDSTAHFMYDFAAGFAKLKHEVFVVLPFTPKLKVSSFRQFKLLPFRYIWPSSWHFLGFGQSLVNDQKLPFFAFILAPFYFIFALFALLKYVKKYRIEVINAHWVIPNGIIAALVSYLAKRPLFITLPGSDVYLARQNIFFRLMTKLAIKQAKRVISNSPQLLTDLNVRGEVISYPVPQNNGKRAEDKIVKIATAGRKVEKKGFAVLQEICPRIEIISGLPIDKFRQKLLSVDIFAAFSIRDSRGNLDDASLVVLEAMAAGCAVVVSDLSGYRSIIKNGQNGLLISPDNKKRWINEIIRLKKSKALRQRLGEAAFTTIAREFTPVKISRKYMRVFNI